MTFKIVLKSIGTILTAFSVYMICELCGLGDLVHSNDWLSFPMLYAGLTCLAISAVIGRNRNDG